METATALWQQVTGTMPDEAAKGLVVEFEIESVLDEAASDVAGRPVYVEKEFISKRSPNDPFSIVHRLVEPADLRAFPQLYKRFKEGASDALTGTPLKEWAPIAKSQVQRLSFAGVRTVEQFADVSDDGCQQLGHGFLTLRNKAIAWLLQAKDASQVTKMAAELEKRDQVIAALQRQVSEIAGRNAEKDDAAPPRRTKKEA